MPGEAELNFASKRGVGAGAGVKLAGHNPLFLRLLINRALTKSPTHGGVRANSRLLELDRGESAAADGRETQVDWRANFGATMDDGAIVLGTIELGTKTVTLSVNSEARAARGRAMLEPILAGLARAPLVERQSIEQMMA